MTINLKTIGLVVALAGLLEKSWLAVVAGGVLWFWGGGAAGAALPADRSGIAVQLRDGTQFQIVGPPESFVVMPSPTIATLGLPS